MTERDHTHGADDPLAVARGLLNRGIMPLPLKPGMKMPFINEWQNLTIDNANVESFFDGARLNVGGRMGAKSGGLCDTDLDAVEAVRLAPYFLPPTPSRYGRLSKRESHRLYRCSDAVEPKGAIQFKDENGKMIVELRIGGGDKGAQSVMPGSRHDETGELYEWSEDGETARVEFVELKRSVSKLAVAAVLLRHWPTSGRHDRSLGVGGFLARCGLSPDEVYHLVRVICVERGYVDRADADANTARDSAVAFAEGREARGFPWMKDEFGEGVAKAIAKILRFREQTATTPPPGEGAGVTLDDFYAYMVMHNYIYVPSRDLWPSASVNARIPPIAITDEDGNPELDDEGDEKKLKANAWLDQNRPVEQMSWVPGSPMLILNRLVSAGGWIEKKGVSIFNLYRPPTIELGDASKAGPWVEHVRKVYPENADHIIHWFAHRRQKPQDKINHALLLGGAPAIGKDTLLEGVKQAVGPWNFSEISPKQMLGRFNGFLKSTVMRISEARDLGDISRYEFYDAMKAYTAAPPDVLRIDEKNRNEYYVPNVVGVVITTNYVDGVYLPPDDRRTYAAWSELTKGDFTDDYWRKLWGWYDTGGYGHVAAYLAALDISDFNPKAPPTKTRAFWAVVDAHRSPEESELSDLIDALGEHKTVEGETVIEPPKALTVKQLADVMRTENDLSSWLRDRRNSRAIPHRLNKCGYVAVHNETAADGFWVVGGKRQVIYARKELSVSEQFKAAGECKEKGDEEARRRTPRGEPQS
jgi:hypothetical protein